MTGEPAISTASAIRITSRDIADGIFIVSH
jgi:hypothetical protein